MTVVVDNVLLYLIKGEDGGDDRVLRVNTKSGAYLVQVLASIHCLLEEVAKVIDGVDGVDAADAHVADDAIESEKERLM